MENILTVKNLTMSFDKKTVFQDLNFKLKKGSMTALLGPNGTGKTTLVSILMKLLSPSSGEFSFAKGTKLGYVPQFRNIEAEYPLSIEAFVGLNAPVLKNRQVKAKIDHQLVETNLFSLRKTRLGEASGGQKQRAYLAQALLDEPNVIILDEATASLDPTAKNELMSLIKHLNAKHNITVLFVTHDVVLAQKYMSDYLYLNRQTVEQGKMSEFTGDYE